MPTIPNLHKMSFIHDSITRLRGYRTLGEKAMAQLSDAELLQAPAIYSDNSIVILVKHLSGNMQSRWTNFLTEDGEKTWRKRDDEFLHETMTRAQLLELWQQGWDCFLTALENLHESDLGKTVYIRTEPLSVTDAIIRQLMHTAYHVGQLVMSCKHIRSGAWQSLSVPRGGSDAYNASLAGKKH